jgi:hypothetical protein
MIGASFTYLQRFNYQLSIPGSYNIKYMFNKVDKDRIQRTVTLLLCRCTTCFFKSVPVHLLLSEIRCRKR